MPLDLTLQKRITPDVIEVYDIDKDHPFNAVLKMNEVVVKGKAKPLHKLEPAQKGTIKIKAPKQKDDTILYIAIAIVLIIILSLKKQ